MPSDHPDALEQPAVRVEGKVYKGGIGGFHANALEAARDDGYTGTDFGIETGYVDKKGKFYNDREAADHAARIKQLALGDYNHMKDMADKWGMDHGLESQDFEKNRLFMPSQEEVDSKARESGYDTTPLYHGGPSGITEFKPPMGALDSIGYPNDSGDVTGPTYLTPFKNWANSFAEQNANFDGPLKLYSKYSNPKFTNDPTESHFMTANEAEQLRRHGYDAVVLRANKDYETAKRRRG